jgi:hypothetical protein
LPPGGGVPGVKIEATAQQPTVFSHKSGKTVLPGFVADGPQRMPIAGHFALDRLQ